MMNELIPWLLAWLDVDYKAAEGLVTATRVLGGMPDFTAAGGPAALLYWENFTPYRALAAIDAKRRIIAMHTPMPGGDCAMCAGHTPVPCPTIRLLALEYAYMRDYREEWKP